MRTITRKNNGKTSKNKGARRTKELGLGQGEEEGRREIQFIAGRV